MGGDDKLESEQPEVTQSRAEADTSADDAPDEVAADCAAEDDDEPAGDLAVPDDAAPDEEGSRLEDLELENAALNQRVAEFKDKVLRAAAETENLRRRTGKEVDDAKKFGIERILKDLLPVLDNFERAVTHAQADDADPQDFMDGVDMVLGQFRNALERQGVSAFESLGRKFDPNLHEAIHRKETDEAEPGTVVEEFQRGYRIHNRLARPAMVIVAMKPAAPAPEPEPEPEGVEDEPVEIEVEVVRSSSKEGEDGGDDASSDGVDVRELQGDVEVIGATLADATGEILDEAGASCGAVITAVSDLSPAARAGLQAGDLVTNVGSRMVMDARAFKRAVQQSLPRKQPFTIVYRRGGDTHETKVGGR